MQPASRRQESVPDWSEPAKPTIRSFSTTNNNPITLHRRQSRVHINKRGSPWQRQDWTNLPDPVLNDDEEIEKDKIVIRPDNDHDNMIAEEHTRTVEGCHCHCNTAWTG